MKGKDSGLAEFIRHTEEKFGRNVKEVLTDAIDVKISLNDVIYIVGTYVKYTEDAFLDLDAFVSDGHCLGVKALWDALSAIMAKIEWAQ